MSEKILVVGSLNMDLVVRAERHPAVGETILGDGFQTFPGGKGANQAVAAARLGASVAMIGRVGADDFGAALLDTVQRDGVQTDWIARNGSAPTGVALITVDRAGRNTIVVAAGANGELSPQDIFACREAFQDASILLVQLECPLETVSTAVKLAKENGLSVVLNPAPAPSAPLPAELLAQVDFLIPNQTELSILAGGEADLRAAVRLLQSRGAGVVLVTLGEQGALLAQEGQFTSFPAFHVQALDTVAAGDAFVGAFALALAEKMSLPDAVRFGQAAAAISVTRAGAQPSLPSRAEVEEFLRNHPL